jgi:hypothetical protein
MLKSVQAIILTINYLSLPGFPAWYGGNAGGDVKGDRGGTDNIVFNTGYSLRIVICEIAEYAKDPDQNISKTTG